MRFMRTGLVPLGALLGGLVAGRYGLRPSVLVAGLGTLLAVLWTLFSPIRALRAAPAAAEEWQGAEEPVA